MTQRAEIERLVEGLLYCAEHGIFKAVEDGKHVSHREAADALSGLIKREEDSDRLLREAREYVADALDAHEHEDGRVLLRQIDTVLGKRCGAMNLQREHERYAKDPTGKRDEHAGCRKREEALREALESLDSDLASDDLNPDYANGISRALRAVRAALNKPEG